MTPSLSKKFCFPGCRACVGRPIANGNTSEQAPLNLARAWSSCRSRPQGRVAATMTRAEAEYSTRDARLRVIWVHSKHDLQDARDEFFWGENCEQERQEGSRCRGGQPRDIL